MRHMAPARAAPPSARAPLRLTRPGPVGRPGCRLGTTPDAITLPVLPRCIRSPWREEGTVGSRQTVRENPTEVGNQDGLPRRHDYDIEIMANTATGHYVDEDEVFGAISFPTLRRAVRRLPDGTTIRSRCRVRSTSATSPSNSERRVLTEPRSRKPSTGRRE
jgi:hypothetical protein